MPRLLALVIAASIFGTSAAAFAAPAPERVRGTVKSISGTVLVVHTTSGTDETIDLTAKTGYLTVAKSDLDHIDPGGYIGVATKSIGDKLVALGVLPTNNFPKLWRPWLNLHRMSFSVPQWPKYAPHRRPSAPFPLSVSPMT